MSVRRAADDERLFIQILCQVDLLPRSLQKQVDKS
jgi:hypothetical protein